MTEQKCTHWKSWVLLVALVSIVVWISVSVVASWQALRIGSMRQIHCMNQLKIIGVAIEMYVAEWGDRRPPLHTTSRSAPQGKAWPDLLVPYLKQIDASLDGADLVKWCKCPDSPGDRLNYSLNRRIAGLPMRKINYASATIAVFDSVNDSPANNNLNGDSIWRPSDGGVPPVGSLPLWTEKEPFLGPKLPKWAGPRHNSRTNVLWVDGHVGGLRLDSPSESPDRAPRFDPAEPKEQ